MIRLCVLPRLVLLFAAAILSVAVGCSSAPKSSSADSKSLIGTDEQIFMGDTIEKIAGERGIAVGDAGLAVLDSMWDEVKKTER